MNVDVALTAGSLRRELARKLALAFAKDDRNGTAALDARLLLAHALDVDATRLALHDDDSISVADWERAFALVERRIAGEPVARIIGRCWFWDLELEVGPDTLLPRADTETVVEAVLAWVDRRGGRDRAYQILDVGTGSGAILLATLSELPQATGVATDLATGALQVAQRNAFRLGQTARARFVACDWAAAVVGPFDLIVANPPYIESGAIAGLQTEVANYDPALALDGGDDGLDAYRALLADFGRLLAPGGAIFAEIGLGQATDAAFLAEKEGFSTVFHSDLSGIDRVIELRRFEGSEVVQGPRKAD